MSDSFLDLPAGLPQPVDDGACDHLAGRAVASVALQSTGGGTVDLSRAEAAVVYCFPRTGGPLWTPPPEWDAIPGARGCTPESTGFRDHHLALRSLGYEVCGLSTQPPVEQAEAKARLELPHELLSDERLVFAAAMRLPTFEVQGTVLIRRLTLVVENGAVARVFYPVFPPDTHAAEVAAALGFSDDS